MKISGVAIRPGNILEYNGKLWAVLKIQHTQPGKGGAYMQVEMKDIKGGTKTNERFRSADTVELVRLDQKHFQYLYAENDNLVLMDKESYEQIYITKEMVGDAIQFLQDGMEVDVQLYDGNPITIALPDSVVLTIAETEPAIKNQTASSSYKPAIMENGARVMVPPFISSGDRIVVNTADATYIERAK
jgi:elongation factor P